MKIHTVREGESLSDIAKEYGIDEDILRINNEIPEGECATGEELLILTPTRTYTIKRGDSTERLSLRFGVRRRDLLAMNPWICTEGLVPSRRVALSYGEPKLGMAAAHGFLYNGYTPDGLARRLPYLTYVSVGCAVSNGRELRKLFDPRDAVGLVRSADKIPLLRIFDKDAVHRSAEDGKKFSESIINAAISGGYKGITLSGELSEEYLVDLRGKMIGCDLILFTELDTYAPSYFNEYADGSVLSYTEGAGSSETNFYKEFATDAESSKSFIELPSFASFDGGFMKRGDAVCMARRSGANMVPNEDGTNLSFKHKKCGTVSLPSLSSVKAILDIIHEYGYMGVSFDIMRTPLPYLMMYNASFGTSTFTSVRSAEGCSRERTDNTALTESG